jgi:hypothetical protein
MPWPGLERAREGSFFPALAAARAGCCNQSPDVCWGGVARQGEARRGVGVASPPRASLLQALTPLGFGLHCRSSSSGSSQIQHTTPDAAPSHAIPSGESPRALQPFSQPVHPPATTAFFSLDLEYALALPLAPPWLHSSSLGPPLAIVQPHHRRSLSAPRVTAAWSSLLPSSPRPRPRPLSFSSAPSPRLPSACFP